MLLPKYIETLREEIDKSEVVIPDPRYGMDMIRSKSKGPFLIYVQADSANDEAKSFYLFMKVGFQFIEI